MLERANIQNQETGNVYNLAHTDCVQGYLTLHLGELSQALTHYTASLALMCQFLDEQETLVHFERTMTSCLWGLGQLAFAQDKPTWSVRLFAAAAAISGPQKHFEPVGIEKASYERVLADAHAGLDKNTFDQAWKVGLAMTRAQVLAAAKDLFPCHEDDQIRQEEPVAPPKSSDIFLGDLTPRQVEVLRLLAQDSATLRSLIA